MAIDEKSIIAITAGKQAEKRLENGFGKSRSQSPFEPRAKDWQALHDAISSAMPSKAQEQFFQDRYNEELIDRAF